MVKVGIEHRSVHLAPFRRAHASVQENHSSQPSSGHLHPGIFSGAYRSRGLVFPEPGERSPPLALGPAGIHPPHSVPRLRPHQASQKTSPSPGDIMNQDDLPVPLSVDDLWDFLEANSSGDYHTALVVLQRAYRAKQEEASQRIIRDANSSDPQAKQGLVKAAALLVELKQLLDLIQNFQSLVQEDTS